MRFAQNRPVKIVMLGAGGTGGHIAPHLYRLLYALGQRECRFLIVDGDLVEKKNLVRQNFIEADLGENKAKVLAERYSSVFGLETEYIPSYIESEEELKKLVTPRVWETGRYYSAGKWHDKTITELVILIGAVDNNKSRSLCHRVFYQIDNLVYIDSGNGKYTGQVVCGIRSGGRTYHKTAGALYPEILDGTDKFPTELSCAEASVSAPQAITANITAACAVVALVYNILVRGETNVQSLEVSAKRLVVNRSNIGNCTAQEVVSLRRYLPNRLLSSLKKLLTAPFRKLVKPKKKTIKKPTLSLPKEPVPKPEPDSELVSAILAVLRERGYTISPIQEETQPVQELTA